MKKNIFEADNATRKRLKIDAKTHKNMTDEILEIFKKAKYEYGKDILTVDEITIAYYNMFTEPNNLPERDKKAITLKLFYMKGGKNNDGVIELVGKGRYKLRS